MRMLSITLFVVMGLSAHAMASDFSKIKKGFREDIRLSKEEAKDFFVEEIDKWSKTQSDDGSWPDIDYGLDDNSFTPGFHAKRFDWMARAYASPGHPMYKNLRVLTVVKKAFDYWTARDIESYNWWHNTIGIPQRFARTMLLMEQELGPQRIQAGIKVLEKAVIDNYGQNRLWYSELTVIRGLFKNYERDVSRGAKEIHKVLDFAKLRDKMQGIQVDLSFHQHGLLIYNGGYGSKYSRDMARLVSIFDGTKYAFPTEKTDLLSKYILDAQIWMSRGDKWDYSVTGREITRPGKSAYKLAQACALLMNTKLPRKDEFRKCYLSLTENQNYLSGNKMFWRSDYMVQHSPKFFTSVRMYSARTINNDAPSNSEGLLSHHLADGTTFVMRRGDEYEDIFPVWDWRRIPGTTTEIKELKPAVYKPGYPELFDHIRYFGKALFVGGATDKESGIAAMNYLPNKYYEKVKAQKTWVLNKDKIYALGNSISCRGCKELVTTIDQKNAKGDVYLLFRDGRVETFNGVNTYNNLKGVYHDGIAYMFPSDQSVTVSHKVQTGNWYRINQQYSNAQVKKKVFSTWVNHDPRREDNIYNYTIVPGISFNDFKNYSFKAKIENHPNWTGIKVGNKIYIASREDKGIHFEGHKFELRNRAIFIYNEKTKTLHVSDPSQIQFGNQIKIDSREYSVDLPSGLYRGKTVKVH